MAPSTYGTAEIRTNNHLSEAPAGAARLLRAQVDVAGDVGVVDLSVAAAALQVRKTMRCW